MPRLLAIGILAGIGVGCVPDAGQTAAPAPAPAVTSPERAAREPFIAMNRDLRSFRSWPRWHLPDIGLRTGHDPGDPRYVYVNHPLEGVRGTLPIGTIVVKTLENGPFGGWEVHAMVKRGGGYNDGGADGWEWMDLQMVDEQTAAITWRGLGSADDPGGYGPDVDRGGEIGCNGCHGAMRETDFVFVRGFLVTEEAERRGK